MAVHWELRRQRYLRSEPTISLPRINVATTYLIGGLPGQNGIGVLISTDDGTNVVFEVADNCLIGEEARVLDRATRGLEIDTDAAPSLEPIATGQHVADGNMAHTLSVAK